MMREDSFALVAAAFVVTGCGGPGTTGSTGDGGGGTATTTTTSVTGGTGGTAGTTSSGGAGATTSTGILTFVGRPPPDPVFVNPQTSSIVNGNIEIAVDNEVDVSALGDGEIFRDS